MTSVKTKKMKLNPYDAYLKERNDWLNVNKDVLGAILIQGIEGEGDDSEDEEKKQVDPSKYTKKQVDRLRYIMLTKDREATLEEMRKFVLGDQADESSPYFNTSFSYDILDGFDEFEAKYKKMKSWSKKFDRLFAYTYNIKEYDAWTHDNEGGMDEMVKQLAKLWKNILKKDDKTLGIDSKYTRPAVKSMLKQFQTSIEVCHSEPPFRFRF